jgi:hypothetical protein
MARPVKTAGRRRDGRLIIDALPSASARHKQARTEGMPSLELTA